MGAWDEDAFGNDMACDWAAEFVENGSAAALEQTLALAAHTPGDESLDPDASCEALAAAEIVAAAAGRPGVSNAYSEDAIAWGATHPEAASVEHIRLALAAIDRITAAESELRDLWLEAVDDVEADSEWLVAVAELRARLAA